MDVEIVYFDTSIARILISKIFKLFWKGIIFSPFGPIVHKHEYPFEIESTKDILTRTLRGGICGSDLHLLSLEFALDVSPTIVPSPKIRFMGHECVSEIVEIGDDVSKFDVGQRVVVQKTFCCHIHQPKNLCPRCSEGSFWLCEKAGQYALLTHYEAAGGWGRGFRYHEDQLVPVPDTISSDQALLIEPLACSLRGILKKMPKENDNVLIIGAGTIGLCTLAVLKAVQPNCNVTMIAKYGFQEELPKKLGVSEAIDERSMPTYSKRKTGAEIYKGHFGNEVLIGGFDVIYDCVGTARTVHNALRWSKGGGTVVLIGIDLKQMKLDLSPVWYQEVDLIGSMVTGIEKWEDKEISTFELVIELLENKNIPSSITDIITHRFDLTDYKEAISTTLDKKRSKAIKVIFDYEK
ncbi:MAG: zinc-dependent alcohol dehydrogenase [Candidatus Heimdallarchaeaceae archaeon]|jgi:threonine dehydrogenase-like Zn-dependent dehydrogenase